MAGQAREGEERGRGLPYSDVQRACRHYGIDEMEYYRHPERYPLPERGTGLSQGSSTSNVWPFAILGSIGALLVGFIVKGKRR